MKTTVEIPDELYRRAKAFAALQGLPMREIIEAGVRLAIGDLPPPKQRKRVEFPLIKSRGEKVTLPVIEAAEQAMDDEEAREIARHIRR